MNKNIFKLILDFFMAIILFSMYNKTTISMEYHEIGGLFIAGVFIIHSLINWRWIKNVTCRITDKNLPIKTKVSWFINLLLFITITLILLSGIMISKTILVNITGSIILWKSIHYFSSALAIILIGIHLGLHWNFIKNIFQKKSLFPQKVTRLIGTFLLIILLAGGVYNTVSSDFSKWITAPFQENIKVGKGLGRGVNANLEEDLDPGKFSSIVITYGSIAGLFAFMTKEFDKRLRLKDNKNNSL